MQTECKHFHKKQPCNNCPYRTDAPLKLWHKSEFENLAAQDTQWGGVYQCHKKDGHVCVGWLMKQDDNRFPNLNLRIMLSKENVTRDYLDQLQSPSPLYNSVDEMIDANYPDVTKKRKRISKNLVWSSDNTKKKVAMYHNRKIQTNGRSKEFTA